MFPATATGARKMPPNVKMTLEFAPTVLFFFAYLKFDLIAATGVIMVTSVISLAIAWYYFRRFPIMPLVSAGMVVVFGSMTLFFHDETFIKVKPTVLNTLFAAVLLGGILIFDRPLLKVLFEEAFRLDDAGWRKLTFRWGLMFLMLALVNEVMWRSFSKDVWVSYKVFGQGILIFLFTLTQVPLIMKHELKDETAETEKAPDGSGA